MNKNNLLIAIGAGTFLTAIIATALIVLIFPEGKKVRNEYDEAMIKADLESNYTTSLETEKTLRSYKASYEADKITYISNKDATTTETQELARAAKTRANRTAANYNELLKSSILDHIKFPEDLETELEYIE